MKKTESERLIQGIMDTLQRAYGDATQTVLDRAAASEVWKYLLEQGAAPPSTVAHIVAAAGGEIHLSEDMLLADSYDLSVFRDQVHGDIKLSVKSSTTHREEWRP